MRNEEPKLNSVLREASLLFEIMMLQKWVKKIGTGTQNSTSFGKIRDLILHGLE